MITNLQPSRNLSVDLLRGLTVLLMLIVNNPGTWNSIYPPLEHAAWFGCTLTDLVFPFFLFVVGMSIELSSRSQQTKEVLRRTVLIFLIGVLIYMFPFFPEWRVSEFRMLGVLQRIALVYCAVALIRNRYPDPKTWLKITGALLVVHYLVLIWIPLPPFQNPVPNAIADGEHSWQGYIDRMLLWGHLWRSGRTWDPEGILSTLSAIGSGLLGLWCMAGLKKRLIPQEKLKFLLSLGLALCALGYAWQFFYPFNKSLWTGSYTLWTAGLASLCLAALEYLVQRWPQATLRAFAPGLWFGRNAMLAFVGSAVFARLILLVFQWNLPDGKTKNLQQLIFEKIQLALPGISAELQSFVYALCFAALFSAVFWWLDKKRIYWKL